MQVRPSVRNMLLAAVTILAVPASATSAEPLTALATPAEKFADIAALAGEWDVQGRETLRIVFEATAGNSVIVERWMRGDRTHSLTIYHLDGNKLIATHYCPQGNQPRIAAQTSAEGDIRFAFQDATDLDSSESFQHDLRLMQADDGSLVRSEIYWGPEGAGEESTLILTRAAS